MKVLFYNYSDEKLLFTQEQETKFIPKLHTVLQVQETNTWYEVVDICLYRDDVEIYIDQIVR